MRFKSAYSLSEYCFTFCYNGGRGVVVNISGCEPEEAGSIPVVHPNWIVSVPEARRSSEPQEWVRFLYGLLNNVALVLEDYSTRRFQRRRRGSIPLCDTFP